MFRIEVSSFGNFKIYSLIHQNSNTALVLAPEYGATVLQIQFDGVKILESFENPDDLHHNLKYKNAVLLPFPNRLKNGKFNYNNRAFQFPLNDPDPPVNALHGFAGTYPTRVEEIKLEKDFASITCKLDFQGEFPYFPFPFKAFIKYLINVNGDFSMQFTIENSGAETLPIGMGWHPYFKLPGNSEKLKLTLPGCKKIHVDKNMIPTGEKTDFSFDQKLNNSDFDTAFELEKKDYLSTIVLQNDVSKLSFYQKTGVKGFNFFQIYIPPNRQSVAIEPMSCNIDAFNNKEGLIEITPEESWVGDFGLKFEKL